jgi:cellulose synthase operon protein C
MRHGIWHWGVVALLAAGPADAAEPDLRKAHQLWQTGKYAESLDAYEKIAQAADPKDSKTLSKIALGRADSLASTGKLDEAVAALAKAIVENAPDADLLARIADIEFGRGRWDEAEAKTKDALKVDKDHMPARWVVGRLHESRGESKEALAQWKWFVDYYNVRQNQYAKQPETLCLIGQAAEKYYRASARGRDLSESLNDVINEIYETAAKGDPRCWQAPWLEGRMFLSGYNESIALRELNRALQINPMAPEIIVTMGQADLQGYKLSPGRRKAEEALEINPHYAPAMILLADLNITDERFTDAFAAARRAVAENPKDEEALGRLAASCRLLTDPIGAAAAEAIAKDLNPKPAAFYAALGERLADRRKYHSAERAFLAAVAADPEGAAARIGLGMLYMQVGREVEARALFIAAFAADPFNVRADNMMKVLKHLSAYTSIKTDHYSVVVDPAQDMLLGKYMSKYLESIHPEMTKRFGYTPPGLTQIEILKNHQWFSGRTTGLPFVPTVGACTGKVVALASPKTMKKPFNWSRVLIHEVAHVITLQQTRFNIPHWYTEALAVESEGTPRPQAWNKLLLERVPTRTKLLNLDTINLGFIRPQEPDQRQLAYCQSQLYAQYMLKRFGPDALIKMLDSYRQGLTTDRAVKASFDVEKPDFEEGYLKFLDGVVKTIRTRVSDEDPITFSQLERQLAAKPDDPDLNAKLAYEHFARRDYRDARPLADKALKLAPHHPLASYVKARLLISIGDEDAALAVIEPALDPKKPNERVVDLLAELLMKSGKLKEAEDLYELARKDDPYRNEWIAKLARVHLRQERQDKLLEDLAMMAANDSDDLDVRTVLAQKHLDASRFDEAAKWAVECLYIQVYDPLYHLLLADASMGQKHYSAAVEEYRNALELKPKKGNDVKVKLAKALKADGKSEDAKAALDEVLAEDPEHPAAKSLKADWEKAS